MGSMMLRFFAFLVFLAITYSHPGIDESYPYSDYYFACISGRYWGGLGFVSSSHPESECVAKCSGRSQMYSILTYVPNKTLMAPAVLAVHVQIMKPLKENQLWS